MSESLTAAHSARKLLSVIIAEDGGKTGLGMDFNVVRAKFLRDGGTNEELKTAVDYALEEGWVEKGMYFILLTEAGVEEAEFG
jgi:hypothetical protein